MKKSIIVGSCLAVLILLSTSCENLMEMLGVTFPLTTEEVEFEILPVKAGEYARSREIINMNLQEQMEEGGFDQDMFNKIITTSGILTLKSGAPNFNAFDNFLLTISSGDKSDSVAWIPSIPEDVTEVELILSDADLMKYIELESFTLEASGLIKEDVTDTIYIIATNDFEAGF